MQLPWLQRKTGWPVGELQLIALCYEDVWRKPDATNASHPRDVSSHKYLLICMLLLTHVTSKGWLTSKETSYKAMMISEDKLIVILSPKSKNQITEGLLVLTTVIVNSTEMRFQLNV